MIMQKMEALGLVSLVTQRQKRDKVATYKFSKGYRLCKVKENIDKRMNGYNECVLLETEEYLVILCNIRKPSFYNMQWEKTQKLTKQRLL